MLSLEKDDTLLIRNYASTTSALQSNLYVGGVNKGNNETLLLMKIAPLPSKKDYKEWSLDCLSKRKQYLFKKILDKMLCDKELVLKGFNVHGTFHSSKTQTVLTESNVIFDASSNVAGSPAYINLTSTYHQILNVNQSIGWEITSLKKEFHHRQATTSMASMIYLLI